MKKIIYSTIAICFLAGCSKYAEGELKTTVTDVTNTSAILYGHLKIATMGSKAKTVAQGFIYGTNPGQLTIENSNMIYDETANEGTFSKSINGLLPNTKYFTKAFILVAQFEDRYDAKSNEARLSYSNGKFVYARYWSNSNNSIHTEHDLSVFYGNTIEFTTNSGSATTGDVVTLVSDGIMVQRNDRSSGTDWNTAKNLCSSSTIGGYNDWRLPTKGELALLYDKRNTIGGFVTNSGSNSSYWSSTIDGYSYYTPYYCYQNFSNGTQSSSVSDSYRCRCVRSLP